MFGTSRMLRGAGSFSVSCNEAKVERESTVRYLGVTFDEKLSGDVQLVHALKIVGKISARLSFLFRKSSMLDMKCL